MALKLNERYPQRWDSPSNDYPQGAFKNLTELGEQDGSYLEQDWLNDYSGFFGALLRNAEMTPNGEVDTAIQSQFYDALYSIVIRNLNDAVPVGAVKAYIGGNTPNDKWLLCRGQAFSAESYPDLAQLLPDLKIPDLRGVALRGLDANRGFDPSRALLSYQEDAVQQIHGTLGDLYAGAGSSPSGAFYSTSVGKIGFKGMTLTENFDGQLISMPTIMDSAKVSRVNPQNETVMKNVAVNFIIKAR